MTATRYHCPKCDVYATSLYGSSAIHAPCGTYMTPTTDLQRQVITHRRTPEYLSQIAAGARLAAQFCGYAQSLGVKFIGLDELECTVEQSELLDAWWRENSDGTRTSRITSKIPNVEERERCNCGASCGENRYHDKYEPGCRYHCEYCAKGAAAPPLVRSAHSRPLTYHDVGGVVGLVVCKRIHG